MTDPSGFVRFGPGHWLALVLTVLVPFALAWATRRRVRSTSRMLALLLAFGLIGAKWISRSIEIVAGDFTVAESLPMHLCDWALFAAIIALLRHEPLAFELAWCWGLA